MGSPRRVARVSAERPLVLRIGPGHYRVEHEGRSETVYVVGRAGDRWAFWNGRVYRSGSAAAPSNAVSTAKSSAAQTLTAPMPATVLKVLVAEGSSVRKGDTVIVLEAMKMELPIRTMGEGVVSGVHCREGELVQPEAVLVEIVPAGGETLTDSR
jgi:biotin carboxyl carrier protein